MKKMMFIILCLLFLVGCKSKGLGISDAIIGRIDSECTQSGTCTFSIADVTDFQWDKAAFFVTGSSQIEISEVLGVRFTESTDLMYGMVFVHGGEIVYQELFPYYPEKPAKLWIQIGDLADLTTCKLITPDNSQVIGNKEEADGRYYYSIKTSN